MGGHRTAYKTWVAGDNNYITSFKIIALGDAYIDLVEVVEFDTRDQLNAVESKHIRANDCVNKIVPGRTDKQYRMDNRDNIIERDAKYHKNNRETRLKKMSEYRAANAEHIKEYTCQYNAAHAEHIKEKHNCDCGGQFTTRHKTRHMSTAKHQAFELK